MLINVNERDWRLHVMFGKVFADVLFSKIQCVMVIVYDKNIWLMLRFGNMNKILKATTLMKCACVINFFKNNMIAFLDIIEITFFERRYSNMSFSQYFFSFFKRKCVVGYILGDNV